MTEKTQGVSGKTAGVRLVLERVRPGDTDTVKEVGVGEERRV